jgi:hypothetical protein
MGSAMSGGARQFGLVAADDAFGRALAVAMRRTAADLNLPAPGIALYNDRAGAAGPVAEMSRQVGGQIDAVVILKRENGWTKHEAIFREGVGFVVFCKEPPVPCDKEGN